MKCPFCGGVGEYHRHGTRVNYGSYESTRYEAVVICNECGARGEAVHIETFHKYFRDNTVNDYRDNPALRAKCEDEYEIYEYECKSKSIAKWGTRV